MEPVKMRTLIRDVREEAGLSQVKLAKRAEVPLSTLTNWEQGRRAPNDIYKLKRIANVLRVPVDDLIDWKSVDLEDDRGK